MLRDQKAVAPFKRITLAFYEASVASNLRRARTQQNSLAGGRNFIFRLDTYLANTPVIFKFTGFWEQHVLLFIQKLCGKAANLPLLNRESII